MEPELIKLSVAGSAVLAAAVAGTEKHQDDAVESEACCEPTPSVLEGERADSEKNLKNT